MKKVFIVTYEEEVEVVLSKRSDFKKWLKEHNKKRKDDGNEPEDADEFDISEADSFIPKG